MLGYDSKLLITNSILAVNSTGVVVDMLYVQSLPAILMHILLNLSGIMADI